MKKKLLTLLIFICLCISLAACSMTIRAQDLMAGVTPSENINVERAALSDFAVGQMAFSVELLRQTVANSEGENVLISPLSVSLALSMTANGAQGETQAQMLQVLSGGMEMDQWNQSLYEYVRSFTDSDSAQVGIANSLWFRNGQVSVKQPFLQTVADYYGASAFRAPFDHTTVKDINRWVKDHTDGMIDEIVGEIGKDTMLYLINALVFESDWQSVYYKTQVSDGTFTAADGTEQSAKMMSCELFDYIEIDGAVGFCKDYDDGEFYFVALLPNQGTDVSDFVDTLTVEVLTQALNNVEDTKVETKLPKFSYEYSVTMKDLLISMGMTDAFDLDRAEFSDMATVEDDGNLYISDVLHKTYIEVAEKGTRAAAVTKVVVDKGAAPPMEEPKQVFLDRPFVYLIIDREQRLPLFMGVVNSVE